MKQHKDGGTTKNTCEREKEKGIRIEIKRLN